MRFPFLDYSTLDKRKAACEAEIEVNRPFAPDIYRRVVAITREADGRLALDGDGEPVEWAVEMRALRRDADARSSRRARRLDAGARRRTRPRGRGGARARAGRRGRSLGSRRSARFVDAERWRRFAKRPSCFPHDEAAHLTRAQPRGARTRCGRCWLARRRTGLVRRGHGDLHLGNIVLIDGQPVLFDAIEFDPLIATGDVLYDLAFLLMDLIERGLQRRRQHRAQPLSGRDAPRRGPRRARGAAAVPVAARRDPRQGDGGAQRTRRRGRARDIAQAATTYFRLALR